MRQIPFGLVALLVLGLASVASAAPVITFDAVYRDGNTCPTNADMTGDADLTVQYSVNDAIECMYITNVSNGAGNTDNPTGEDAEANAFLNDAAAGLAGWGSVDFLGLGSTDGGIDGFSFTSVGGKTGSFLIGDPLTEDYNQFAIALKDGGDPKFAIFLMPVDDFGSQWSFESQNGSISHFALFGRLVPDSDDPPVITETPEPASMLLLGAGLVVGGKIRNRRKRNSKS